jgi:hypothetical protein
MSRLRKKGPRSKMWAYEKLTRFSSLNFNFQIKMVGAAGFEPATFCTPCNCATELRHAPMTVNFESFPLGKLG